VKYLDQILRVKQHPPMKRELFARVSRGVNCERGDANTMQWYLLMRVAV
jgi:hypothetical protein